MIAGSGGAVDRAVLDDRPEVIAGAVVTMQRCVLNFARFVCGSQSLVAHSAHTKPLAEAEAEKKAKASSSSFSSTSMSTSTSTSTLASSALASIALALLAASTHPAELLGLAPRLGTLRFGATADLVVLEFDARRGLDAPDALHVLATFVGGRCVYVRDEQTRIRLNIPSKLVISSYKCMFNSQFLN